MYWETAFPTCRIAPDSGGDVGYRPSACGGRSPDAPIAARRRTNAALINRGCGRMVEGKRCAGKNGREMRKTDWKECPACSATGFARAGTCERCDGAGWLFVRSHSR